MSYYEALGFSREPFSNSPDPQLLYRSRVHLECLQQMEIAVRLRRGLNIVLGEVGTGKTTLARELIRLFDQDQDIEAYLLDDPYYPTPAEFLLALLRLFGRDGRELGRDIGLLRDALKSTLLDLSGGGQRTVALLVDEGQKLTGESLELLRELLNFEANTHKILQIVIFGQTELQVELAARPNLEDRVNFRYRLTPLDRAGTRAMIETRMALCMPTGQAPDLFTPWAMGRIHRLSKGYPRKIVRLCHMSMLLAIGLGKRRIGWSLVGRAARESRGPAGVWLRRLAAVTAVGGLAAFGLGILTVDMPPRELSLRAWSSVRAMLNTPARPVAPKALAQKTVAPSATATPAGPEIGDVAPEQTRPEATAANTPQPDVGPSAPTVAPAQVAEAPAQPVPTTTPGQVAPTEASAAPSTAPSPSAQSQAPAAPALPETVPAAVRAVPATLADSDPIVIPVGALLPGGTATVTPAVAPVVAPAVPVATAAVSSAARSRAIPEDLGRLAVRPGWSATRLVSRIYGLTGRAAIDELAKANPGVDLNRMRVGDRLVFPTIEAAALPAGTNLIRVAPASSLEEAYGLVDQLRRKGLSVVAFVTYHPQTGLRYEVVLRETFGQRDEAVAAVSGLPRGLGLKPEVVEPFKAGTVYFTALTEPVGNGGRRTIDKPLPFGGRQVAQSSSVSGLGR